MKVIDQINGSALFAQSAFSASIATKDNLGRDITATYLTGIDLGEYYKKTETSSKGEISDALANIPQGDPDVNNFVQTNSSTIVNVDNVVQSNSAGWGISVPTGNFVQKSDVGFIDEYGQKYVNTISGYPIASANSARWAQYDSEGYTITSRYVDNWNLFGISSVLSGAIDYVSGQVPSSGDFALKSDFGFETVQDAGFQYFLFTVSGKAIGKALSSQKTRDDIDGWPIQTTYLKISAASALSSTLSGAIDYISANGGKTYTGVAPIQVNNTSNEISITGESLSAGPGIDLFESGGYVVISAYGGNSFPITGSNGTTAYTANMDCSSVLLTTASSPAGGYVKQTVQGVQYEAYPATDVSASWYNIINGANNRSNCYCIRFTNDLTAADLANYSAYDKVTVVHSNQYTPDCNLYWDGKTKVFPSGLYCELVKGTNDQNQTDWFFTTSGWINNLEWDWD